MAYVRFLSIVAVICFGAYSGLLLLGMSRPYCEFSTSFDISACYKFDVHDQTADILLVGDSALLYGIQPKIVAAITHKSAYNYGIIGEMFSFDPDAVIERYIEKNRKPRAIIAYIGPWDLIEPGRIIDPRYFPVAAAALQHPHVVSLADLLVARPSAIVELPQIIGTGLSFSHRRQILGWRTSMEAELGFVDYAHEIPLEDRQFGECPRKWKDESIPDASASRPALEKLKARYAAQGIEFFVYVAPFARCHTNERQIQTRYRGIADNRITALDDSLFVVERESGLGGQVHVNAAGSTVVSEMLGQFILSHRIAGAR